MVGSEKNDMGADEVLRVLAALATAGITVGITGGWGVDALLGRQTRKHRDLDLGLGATEVEPAVEALGALGYSIASDERPARLELVSGVGKVDLHPIVWDSAGQGMQTGSDGERFVYPAGSLDHAGSIAGQPVNCGSPGLQLEFHLGYAPSHHDRADMNALAEKFRLTLPSGLRD